MITCMYHLQSVLGMHIMTKALSIAYMEVTTPCSRVPNFHQVLVRKTLHTCTLTHAAGFVHWIEPPKREEIQVCSRCLLPWCSVHVLAQGTQGLQLFFSDLISVSVMISMFVTHTSLHSPHLCLTFSPSTCTNLSTVELQVWNESCMKLKCTANTKKVTDIKAKTKGSWNEIKAKQEATSSEYKAKENRVPINPSIKGDSANK